MRLELIKTIYRIDFILILKLHCFSKANHLQSGYKTNSTPASLSLRGQDTKHTAISSIVEAVVSESNFETRLLTFSGKNWLVNMNRKRNSCSAIFIVSYRFVIQASDRFLATSDVVRKTHRKTSAHSVWQLQVLDAAIKHFLLSLI